MTRRRRRLLVLLLLLGALAGGYLGRGVLLPPVAHWLDVSQPPRVADAVMLLNGEPDTRSFAAGVLLRKGWAPHLYLAKEESRERGPVPHELNRKVLHYTGVTDEQITMLDAQANSTYDEAVALAAVVDHKPIPRLLIVTDGYHSRRSRWIFAQVLGPRVQEITMVSPPMEWYDADHWWQDEKGFTLVMSEYLKFAFYAVRYGHRGYQALGGLGLLAVIFFWWRRRMSV